MTTLQQQKTPHKCRISILFMQTAATPQDKMQTRIFFLGMLPQINVMVTNRHRFHSEIFIIADNLLHINFMCGRLMMLARDVGSGYLLLIAFIHLGK